MQSCPSCAAPLDQDGICPVCGSLSRGFFRGLDLGPPQIAHAVTRGLDFYKLLEVEPTADLRTIARRYRRLRVLFPDNPARLAPEPARKLELLELAGRVLTDPRLRQAYDDLRSQKSARAEIEVVRCSACSAPLAQNSKRCEFCGTPRPVEHQAPQALPPAGDGPPPAEPIDYYALLGLTAEHLDTSIMRGSHTEARGSRIDPRMQTSFRSAGGKPIGLSSGPPSMREVDDEAYKRQRAVLMSTGLSQQEREARANEYEIARRILRDERRRSQYDALLIGFAQGKLDAGRLDALRQLQETVLAEYTEEQGQQLSAEQTGVLMRQAIGYLDTQLPREALPLLRRVLAVAPGMPEAHAAFVRATLAADDPLVLGGHTLRQVLSSLEALEALNAPLPEGTTLAPLCRGLIAREEGRIAEAERELQRAVQADPNLAPAWRALAVMALGRGAYDQAISCCQRALAVDRNDERVLLIVVAACLRARQKNQAREAADQIAQLRGGQWTAAMIMREAGG